MLIDRLVNKVTGLEFKKILLAIFWITLLLFPISLYTIYLFPLFPDEIAIRPYLSRLPYDFPNRSSGMAVCFSNIYQKIPLSHLLPGSINWLIHGLIESPTTLRKVGLLIFLSWSTGITIYLIHKTYKEDFKNLNTFIIPVALIISLFFVGVYPFFLVMNRNEQFFFPSLALLIYTFIVCLDLNNKPTNNSFYKVLLVIIYIISTSLILYAHGKGLFLIPFFLIIAWVLANIFLRNMIVFFSLSFFILASAIQDYFVWKTLYKCPDYIDFELFLHSFAIDPTSFFFEPASFFEKIYQSFTRTPEYLDHIIFKTEYQWNYLKSQKSSLFVNFINSLIKINLSSLFVCLFIFIPFFYYRDYKLKNYITSNFLLLILLLTTTLSSLFNLTKNFYDADYLYTLLIIIFIFFVTENKFFKLDSIISLCGVAYLCLISISSQFILIKQNLQPFHSGFTGPGVAIGRYEKGVNQSIRLAADMCDIDPNNSDFVITDDLTYGYFRKSHSPISYTYIFIDNSPDILGRTLRKIDSSGIILDCGSMKEDLRNKSIQVDGICCLSKTGIKNYFYN